jgi:hypothetical protein
MLSVAQKETVFGGIGSKRRDISDLRLASVLKFTELGMLARADLAAR